VSGEILDVINPLGFNASPRPVTAQPLKLASAQATQPQSAKSIGIQPAYADNSQPNLADLQGALQELLGSLIKAFQPVTDGAQPGQGTNPGTDVPFFPGDDTNQPPESQPGDNPQEKPINTALVEVGAYTDGTSDTHAQEVNSIFNNNTAGGNGKARLVGIGNENPDTAQPSDQQAKPIANEKQLGEMVDTLSTDSLNTMTDKLNEIEKNGQERVVNGSLGYTRTNVYMEVAKAVKNSPKVGQKLGLNKSDIDGIQLSQDGEVDPNSLSPKVRQAVVKYVDTRMNKKDSKYNQALGRYDAETKDAAKKGINVVVAAGNDGENKKFFPEAKTGADTNFLMQSDNVISAAASNDNGTPDNAADDTIADFSSRGDGKHNPTVAAKGVQVDTGVTHPGPDGSETTLDDGTSFAAPQVSATVARMLEANPNLSSKQIKEILQGTATNTKADAKSEGAGIMNTDKALEKAKDTKGELKEPASAAA
jgi:hypothetical protein